MQVRVELAGPFGQGVQEAPQESTLASLRHCPSQRWCSETQAHPHAPFVQVLVELAGPSGHGVQEDPHESGLASLKHSPPQRWRPASHANPHAPSVQVRVELAGPAGQGVHPVGPQVSGLASLTQVSPSQLW